MSVLFRLLRIILDLRAAWRGPGPYVRRQVQRKAHRRLGRWFR